MKRLKLIASIWKQEWWIRYVVYYLLAYSVLPGKPKSGRDWTRYRPHRSSVDWLRYDTLYRSVVDIVFTLLIHCFCGNGGNRESRKRDKTSFPMFWPCR